MALCDYAAMGPGRSLDKLAERYRSDTGSIPTKRRSTLADWSRSGDWQARVASYDAAQLAAERAALEAQRLKRRQELEEADWADGGALRSAVAKYIADLPQWLSRRESETTINGERVRVIMLALGVGPGELARALETASKVQRLAVGEPTEATAITIQVIHDDTDDPPPQAP